MWPYRWSSGRVLRTRQSPPILTAGIWPALASLRSSSGRAATVVVHSSAGALESASERTGNSGMDSLSHSRMYRSIQSIGWHGPSQNIFTFQAIPGNLAKFGMRIGHWL